MFQNFTFWMFFNIKQIKGENKEEIVLEHPPSESESWIQVTLRILYHWVRTWIVPWV